MQLAFEPHIPLALWTPLAVLAAALWVVYALASRQRLGGWRRLVTLALMAIAIALPLGILLNPTWTKRLPPPAGKPLLTVLVDDTQSMATTDGANGMTRFAQAAAIAQQVERELGDRFEVELKTFGTSVKPTTAKDLPSTAPEGDTTDIASGLESSLADRPQGQAILLLGDGVHNAGGGAARLRQSAERAKAMATPIYTTTLGQQTTVRDLEVSLNLAEELAFVDQEVPLVVSLRQRGQLTGSAKVTIQLDGKPVDSRTVSLNADGQQEVFAVKQTKAGLYRYDIVAEEIPGEVTSVNNYATLMLRVVDEPVRVALLEGKPYWDTKFLVRTLSADPSVELTSVVRMTAGRFLERRITRPQKSEAAAAATEPVSTGSGGDAASDDAAKPAAGPALQSEAWEIRQNVASLLEDADSLKQFQVIILGRDAEAFLTDKALVQLKKWLAQGEGSLVCFRGSPSSQVNQRLGELMPVKWAAGRESRFRVRLTESGEAMGWMPRQETDQVLTNLPSLATSMKPERTKPLAVVLATGAGQGAEQVGDPVISFQPIGNGRVVVLEGAGMWRWAFLPAEFQQHDEVYGRLWRSLTRWLISNIGLLPSQQQALRSHKITFGNSDIATGTLLTRVREGEPTTKPPQIELTIEAIGRTQLFTPVASDEVPGQFRVVFGKLPEGRYQAQIVGAIATDTGTRAAFDVRGNFTERLDVAARTDVMKLIAQRSGGAVLAADGATELADKFAAHQAANMPEQTQRITAWDRWWVLLIVIGAWAVAWGVRRRAGLV